MGNDDVRAARPGEAGAFGVRTEFDGHFFSAFDFKDAVGNVRFGDVRFISRIIDDDEVVFFGSFDPVGQFFFAHGRASRVGRVAEVDDVDFFRRRYGFEAIFRCAGKVDDAVVNAFSAFHSPV